MIRRKDCKLSIDLDCNQQNVSYEEIIKLNRRCHYDYEG